MSANIRHSSESADWGSPKEVGELAHAAMGGVDLDPASCEEANKVIKAAHIFTKADNGFKRPWFGRVLSNPPGGFADVDGHEVHQKTKNREACSVTGSCGLPIGHKHVGVDSSAKMWWFKLAREWGEGRVTSALFVCFDMGMLQTTQVNTPQGLFIPLKLPICYPAKRLKYNKLGVAPEEKLVIEAKKARYGAASPPHASCLVFLPSDEQSVVRFKAACKKLKLGEVVTPRED